MRIEEYGALHRIVFGVDGYCTRRLASIPFPTDDFHSRTVDMKLHLIGSTLYECLRDVMKSMDSYRNTETLSRLRFTLSSAWSS